LKRTWVFFLKSFLLSAGSANRESHGLPVVHAGKKAFASPKKAVVPLFKCGLPPFQPGYPFATASLAEKKKGEFRKFLPTLFGFGACFFPRATKKRV